MTAPRYDVVGIGNAIVDVLARTDDHALARLGLAKGAMTLIEVDRAEALYAAMGSAIECSGGSAANTLAGVASLGSRAAYIGKVAEDQLGAVFRHDIRATGVAFDSKAASSGAPTARCLIFVTPDAQRTMQTYLGACVDLGPEDVEEGVIAGSAVTYLEGYLWDKPAAKDAFRKAMRLAHAAGRKVSLTLSDAFCVGRHRTEFLDLVENHVDILFANESEITALYEVGSFDEALHRVQAKPERIAALTRSEKGSVAVKGSAVHAVPAETGVTVVDTTGAGDLYAAGFLHGVAQGRDLATCARLGGLCAAEVISHVGARPERKLSALVAERLG